MYRLHDDGNGSLSERLQTVIFTRAQSVKLTPLDASAHYTIHIRAYAHAVDRTASPYAQSAKEAWADAVTGILHTPL